MQILEKQFEDWICENIKEVAGEYAHFVGRQISLPNGGILDVLAAAPYDEEAGQSRVVFYIIEVKKETIDPAAIQQVLTYMGAFKDALSRGFSSWQVEGERWDVRDPVVRGIVAAPSITNEAVWLVKGSGVRYVRLQISVSAQPWYYMLPGVGDKNRVGSLAADLIPIIASAVRESDKYEEDMRRILPEHTSPLLTESNP